MTWTPTVDKHDHPVGEAGVRYSLEKVAELVKRAQEAFRSPEIRQLALQILDDAKKAGAGIDNDEERAKAILYWVQENRIWAPDPVGTEMMTGAHLTACVNPNAPCFRGGDCDDLVILTASLLLAVGIYACIVGHAYRSDRQIVHVLAAAWCKGKWHYCDPSKPQGRAHYPFGSAQTPTRERVLALPNGKVICDQRSCFKDNPGMHPDKIGFIDKGVFVGIDGVPEDVSLQELSLGHAPASRVQWVKPSRVQWVRAPGTLGQTADEIALTAAQSKEQRTLSRTEKIAIAGVIVSALGILIQYLWMRRATPGAQPNPLQLNPISPSFGKRLRKEIEQEHRAESRQRIRTFREQAKQARERRGRALLDLRASCQGRVAKIRAAREALVQKRRDVTTECRAARAETRAIARHDIDDALQSIAEERGFQREIHRKVLKQKPRRGRGEALSESDDEVRRNIAPELVPIFNRVRRDIKGSARRSRTEAFLEWVEAHPDEVSALEAESAESDADRMFHDYMSQLSSQGYEQNPSDDHHCAACGEPFGEYDSANYEGGKNYCDACFYPGRWVIERRRGRSWRPINSDRWETQEDALIELRQYQEGHLDVPDSHFRVVERL